LTATETEGRNSVNPTPKTAGTREAGAECPHCKAEIGYGDEVASCPDCGTTHHWRCWQNHGGCGAYECAPAHRAIAEPGTASLRIESVELERAVPLPPAQPLVRGAYFAPPPPPRPSGVNRTAKAALIVGLLGIPLFGVVTGLVAILLGSLAIGSIHHTRQKGTGMAVAGLLLGVADVVGWLVFLAVVWSSPSPHVEIAQFEPDEEALENLPPAIGRAMRANVLITAEPKGWRNRLGGVTLGSGVILRIEDGEALVVTNRHVVDPDFAGGVGEHAGAPADGDFPDLMVKLVGQIEHPGHVLWVAPDGLDLALVSVAATTDAAEEAVWQAKPRMTIDDKVFAIGNPHGLGWTHTRGVISQLRRMWAGERRIRIIQTSTQINPGNSGGGLYDEKGNLIGINTYTNDKRVSEGLSFAIAFKSLTDLAPGHLKIPEEQKAEP
jgi:hypothetical protein